MSYPPVGAFYSPSRLGYRTLVGCLLSPSRCILQPWPTGLQDTRWLCLIPQSVNSTADWATWHTLVVNYPPVGAFYSPGRLGYRKLVGCVLSPQSVHSTADWATGHTLVVTYPPVGAFYSTSRLGYRTLVGCVLSPSRCILQPRPTRLTGHSFVVYYPPVGAFSWAIGHSLVVSYSPVGAIYSPSRLGYRTIVCCVLSPSQCLLQPQPTGLQDTSLLCIIPKSVHSTADWATGHSFVVYYPPVGSFYSPSRLGYRTLVGCVLSPSRCILQPQPTRLQDTRWLCIIPKSVDSRAPADWATGHLVGCVYPQSVHSTAPSRLGYRTLIGCVLSPNQSLLQPRPTGLQDTRWLCLIPQLVHSTAPAGLGYRTLVGCVLSPNRCLLQPQPTGLQDTRLLFIIPQSVHSTALADWDTRHSLVVYYPQSVHSTADWVTGHTLVVSYPPSWCILQPQPTGLQDTRYLCLIPQSVHSTALADWATGHSLVVYYPQVGAIYSRLGYRTHVGCVLSPSRCILQPQPTGLPDTRWLCLIPQSVQCTADWATWHTLVVIIPQSVHSTAPADWATGHSLVVSYPPVGAFYSRLGYRTHVGCVLSPSRCILQPQPTGLQDTRYLCLIPQSVHSTADWDTGHTLVVSYPQLVHSTAPADWHTGHSLVVYYPPVGAFYSLGRLCYRTLVGCVLSPSRCILQPTGLQDTRWLCLIPQSVHTTADWDTGLTLVVSYPQFGAFYSPSRLGYRTIVCCVLSPSRCILQPWPTGLQDTRCLCLIPQSVQSTAPADWATGHSLFVSYPPVGAIYSRLGYRTHVGCVLSPSQCILQPHPTGLQDTRWLCLIPQSVHSTAPADWATGHSLVVSYPPVCAFYSRLGYRTLVGCVLSSSRCIL